jgi:hypothetical protein
MILGLHLKLYNKFQRIRIGCSNSGNGSIYNKKSVRAGSGGLNAQVLQDFPTTGNPTMLVALSVLFFVTFYVFKFYF